MACLFVIGICLDLVGAALAVGGIILRKRHELARLGLTLTSPGTPPEAAFREVGFAWAGLPLLTLGFFLQLLGYLIGAGDWSLVWIAVATLGGAALLGWLAATRWIAPWFHRRAVSDWRAEQREGRWRFVVERGKEEGWGAAEWGDLETWQQLLEEEFRVEVRKVGSADRLDGVTAVTMASPKVEKASAMLPRTAKKPLHDALRELVGKLEASLPRRSGASNTDGLGPEVVRRPFLAHTRLLTGLPRDLDDGDLAQTRA